MPLNVRRLYTSLVLLLTAFLGLTAAQTVSQTPPQSAPQSTTPPQPAPTSGDVMRERISKAKAYIAVRNYNAAIYELENLRRETGDPAVQGVVNVLLMNSYLEQGDFKRAQDFLTQAYNLQKMNKANSLADYNAVAGQIVRSARSRVERYHALGLNISDRMLPLEALNDLEKMRETLELVVTQSKEIAKEKPKTAIAMGLLEEASNSRSVMARDDYDARRWKDEVADSREQMLSSRSVVLSAVTENPPPAADPNAGAANNVANNASNPATQPNNPAVNTGVSNSNTVAMPMVSPTPAPTFNPVREREVKTSDTVAANTQNPVYVPSTQQKTQPAEPSPVKEDPKPEPPKTEEPKPQPETKPAAPAETGPVDVGASLIGYATKQAAPVYPVAARNIRASGVVKVEVTIDEKGDVSVQKTTGPMLLQSAAVDAIKKWKFKPFVRDGQPVKAVGFVNFNFTL